MLSMQDAQVNLSTPFPGSWILPGVPEFNRLSTCSLCSEGNQRVEEHLATLFQPHLSSCLLCRDWTLSCSWHTLQQSQAPSRSPKLGVFVSSFFSPHYLFFPIQPLPAICVFTPFLLQLKDLFTSDSCCAQAWILGLVLGCHLPKIPVRPAQTDTISQQAPPALPFLDIRHCRICWPEVSKIESHHDLHLAGCPPDG